MASNIQNRKERQPDPDTNLNQAGVRTISANTRAKILPRDSMTQEERLEHFYKLLGKAISRKVLRQREGALSSG